VRHQRHRLVAAGLAVASFVTPLIVGTTRAEAAAAASSYRVVASKKAVVDSHAVSWLPDSSYARGGSLATAGGSVGNTASSTLYKAQRRGVQSYSFAVTAPGTYSVVLYLAELEGKNPGQRVYDVTAEGATVASRIDVSAAAGKNLAWHVLLSVPVNDGTLNLGFVPVAGQPAVSAVAVDFMRPELTPTTTFDDEFDAAEGAVPDPQNWTQAVMGGLNHELELYTDHNAVTDGAGSLVISAKQETAVGPLGGTHDYTSSRLTTEGHYTWQYGRAEARILTPVGQGLWPAFWGVGATGRWPANGEIDAMEMKGQQPSTDYGTVHGITAGGAHWSYGRTATGTVLAGSWHTYATVWQPGAIATLVDGRPFMTVTPADLPAGNVWGFDQPFWVRLDLAVGGDFVGSPDATTVFPAVMKIDWVRVTQ